ncbi:Putative uncharacterized protein [Taphrina deformans PYCC 5710]|uniref:Cell wall mannoprotein PIR1-like C-terminal domain-containing protein n=1 Tax=Taphrina deformans (strain PYCC 5710 / ATCC 11124 / CBS 356.35 / IMI 108563 / JCM 9778 / NBRC 8474) TaxID=1097556 RepID=R4X884_TAPDE|nr:Putative uncharacterized protein [Taphrina deformans PYCC 5710]|eukprot:CCG81754.1 Putative uncharacterized protein [Taphrina deformans PYCC 5710]
MFSKIALAASLLSSTMAQSTLTVYSDVYVATMTVQADCQQVCSADAVTQQYTVVASGTATTLVGASAPSGATAASASGICGFQLAVNGSTAVQQISDGQVQAHRVGQITDGQVQSDSGLTASTFTISNGLVYDQAGRICSISGQGQSQFQCNYTPTTGSTTTTFSLVNSNLAYNGNTQFYACLLGDANSGYNIYQTLTGNQNGCSPITLAAVGSTDCGSASTNSVPAAAGPVISTAVVVNVATATPADGNPNASPVVNSPTTAATAMPAVGNPGASPVVNSPMTAATTVVTKGQTTTGASLPVQSTTGNTIFTGSASSVSSKSVSALVLAAALSYFML